jgi:hypothetical protein
LQHALRPVDQQGVIVAALREGNTVAPPCRLLSALIAFEGDNHRPGTWLHHTGRWWLDTQRAGIT